MRTLPLRLLSGDDPKAKLDALINENGWTAACVLTAVGSLTQVALRFADKIEVTTLHGHFEIVSLTGTLSPDGSHLHLAICDGTGVTRGGHLKEGSRVYTTVEIVLVILEEWRFSRTLDGGTGHMELSIEAI